LYLDSNIVIALVEEESGRKAAVAGHLGELGRPMGRCVVSDLVRLECRAKPIASGDAALLHEYDRYFASGDVVLCSLSRSAYDRATHIRARYRFETADALHLAAAIESGCDAFVTADRALTAFGDLSVLLVTTEVND